MIGAAVGGADEDGAPSHSCGPIGASKVGATRM